MKLLFCPNCGDIVKLHGENTVCECGRSWGHYLKDGLHATYGGEAIILGIGNKSLSQVMHKGGGSPKISCWVIDPSLPDCHIEKEDSNFDCLHNALDRYSPFRDSSDRVALTTVCEWKARIIERIGEWAFLDEWAFLHITKRLQEGGESRRPNPNVAAPEPQIVSEGMGPLREDK
jgi:hypothetical protein